MAENAKDMQDMTEIRFEKLSFGEGYSALIGAGALDELPAEAGRLTACAKAAVITDSGVPEEHVSRCVKGLSSVFEEVVLVTLPAGEENKKLSAAEGIYERLYEAGFTRADCVVGLGGGVALDIAGFAAATYLRGLGFISVPTTVIAQTDSAYGGKTGVDLFEGKNHIGVFRSPLAVICDTELLATLPERERVCGMGEVIKYGAIAEPRILEKVSRGLPDESTVALCASIKKRFAEADEFDRGERRALNFGHTYGHAIEAASGYSVPHGQAVAYGMLAAVRIGERLGLTEAGVYDRLEAACRAAGLDTDREEHAREAEGFLMRDKKSDGERIDFVLLKKLGEPVRIRLSRDELKL